MSLEFKPSITSDPSQDPEAWWFLFSGYRLLVESSGENVSIPFTTNPENLGIDVQRHLYVGTIGGRPCHAAEAEIRGQGRNNLRFQELRSLFARLEDEFYEAALTAVHLVEWDKTYQFCCKCRGKLNTRDDIRAKECQECGRVEFPRLSPAIIVLIERGNTLLLARSRRFAGQFFSVLAGFVEPGESLESAVRREVKEETGISVQDIQYFGSQPWPFPDSLMIGFTARYESGEIVIDGEEIVQAGWYRADNLPHIPGKLSIARKLIDWFVNKQTEEQAT
jgi:NAD+ diphosphatase